jgi:hypothetical protein
MTDATQPLILDFVAWIAAQPRPYAEVMEAWRTSCPRLPVWEDSIDQGYVVRSCARDGKPIVEVTPRGLTFLASHGRQVLVPENTAGK